MPPGPSILHVAAVPFTARKLLLPQLQYLAESGYQVRLACAPEAGGWGQDLLPFDPVSLAFPRRVQALPLLKALASLPGILRQVRPDIVHLHSPAAALPARLLPRAALPTGLRVAYTVHGFAHQWDGAGLRDRLLGAVEQALAPRADVMLFQSREDYDQACAHAFRTRLRLLGNGVEDIWYSIAPPAPPARLTVLYVGRLVREKGVVDLLAALGGVPQVRLLIAGAALDSDRDSVEQEVRERIRRPALAGRVEMLGMLPRSELLGVVARADVLALPSYREGVPRSVIEALAAGRPALVTDIRGCRELVQNGVNGLVVSPGDVAAMTAALAKLAGLTPAAFTAMSAAARRSVDPARRESLVFKRLVEAYAELGFPP